MGPISPDCLDEERALDLVAGGLEPAARRDAELHLDRCADCRQLVSALARDAAPAPAGEEPGPQRLGRYLLLDPLGSGGMGIVWRAYDPELDRAVALKVLWPGGESDEARERLLREAQCLARIEHPNVVAVFDVGRAGDELFVAMELVKGQTLRRWLVEGRPAPAAILAAYRQAGEGLRAIHAAGLVHRDFKPENALIDAHGRVRVADLGLARIAQGLAEASAAGGPTQPGTSGSLTHASRTVGTPAYMAPEQKLAACVDHRSDQFSFCLALQEALGGAAPPRVARALRRGLAPDPGGRFASMDALLRALDVAARPAWRRSLLPVAAVLVAGLAIGGTQWQAWRQRPCTGADEELERVWPPPRALGAPSMGSASMHVSFARASREQAIYGALEAAAGRQTAMQVFGVLDARARAFADAFRRTCESYRRGEISGRLLDERMQCLHDALAEMEAAVSLLEKADATLAGRSERLVGSLLLPQDCERAVAREDPPAEATRRLRRELVALRPLAIAGERSGRARAEEIRVRAEATGAGPLAAEAMVVAASFETDPVAREAALLQAVRRADRAGNDLSRAEALLLIATALEGSERVRWLDLAEGALDRGGPDARLARAIAAARAQPAGP